MPNPTWTTYMGTGDLNPDLPTCASTLPTEPSFHLKRKKLRLLDLQACSALPSFQNIFMKFEFYIIFLLTCFYLPKIVKNILRCETVVGYGTMYSSVSCCGHRNGSNLGGEAEEFKPRTA